MPSEAGVTVRFDQTAGCSRMVDPENLLKLGSSERPARLAVKTSPPSESCLSNSSSFASANIHLNIRLAPRTRGLAIALSRFDGLRDVENGAGRGGPLGDASVEAKEGGIPTEKERTEGQHRFDHGAPPPEERDADECDGAAGDETESKGGESAKSSATEDGEEGRRFGFGRERTQDLPGSPSFRFYFADSVEGTHDDGRTGAVQAQKGGTKYFSS
ncbi:hypothetical protein HPP92_000333 [Vanilla planifolia]|uniref:Uncharacterized protein n=1 Tax=Vanilla planifolia TaxID=51239 RepID=A0A835S141_VANPL|nr:hypothetical protein HPP92_000333 [Vanilla planifolia]